MKKITPLIAVLLMLININSVIAQQVKNDSLTYTGIIKAKNGGPINCQVRITYSTDDGSGKTGINSIGQTDDNGYFEIRLPDLHKPYTIFLNVRNPKTKTYFFRPQYYYAESGDHITMNLVIDTVEKKQELITKFWANFSGNGSTKYQIAWQLQNPFLYEGYLVEDKKILTAGRYYKGPEDLKYKTRPWKDARELVDNLEARAMLIRKYKFTKDSLIDAANMNPQMRKIFKYSYGAWESTINREWWFRCISEYNNFPAYRDQIAVTYLKYNNEFYEKPDNNAIYSLGYLTESLDRIIFSLKIKNKTDQVDYKDVYNIIKTNYTGATRDYLLRYMMAINKIGEWNYLPYSSTLKDSLLVNALDFIKMPLAKTMLEEELTSLRKMNGSVYDGEFIALDGRKFKLSELRGKVVLLDVWFNGCAGCAEFHSAFNTIFPNFKTNKNFVILSVNVDKTNERWLSGIKSNHYTSRNDSYINVTTGNWFDHPFMNYYNITGASYSMLIDADGRILPKSEVINNLSAEISKALDKLKKLTK